MSANQNDSLVCFIFAAILALCSASVFLWRSKMSSGLTYERRKELNGICTQLGIDSLRIHAYSDEDLDELREKALKIKAGTVFSYHAHQAIGVAHNWSLSRIPFCLEWKHHILDQELSYHHLDSVVEFDPKSPVSLSPWKMLTLTVSTGSCSCY